MKRILAIIAIAASMFAVNAQAQNKAVAAARAALEKAQAATENAKQNTKADTWIKYGKALLDAYNAPAGNFWVGMTAQELQVLAAGERPQGEEPAQIGGQTLTKRIYADKNLYFNQAGALQIIEVTRPVVSDALDKALDAYKKAAELDTKAQKTKDIVTALQSISSKFTDEAYNAYSLGKLADASVFFEKAAKAAGSAPYNQLDAEAIYNAGFTAWQVQDYARAKGFFDQCLENGYYGEGGEAYAKLADIAEKTGDMAASKKYLEEGFQKNPQSQSILIGLINYYLNSGEDTERLFTLFEDAKKNEPNNASLYYVEGNARAKLGQKAEAIAAYDKASEVNPKYEWGYIGKGIMLYNDAVELQDKASLETDDAKYMAMMGEFEKTLKGCIEPFETAFNLSTDNEVKAQIAEYLKNACFRFRAEGAEFQEKYEKYSAFQQQQ